MSKTAQPDATSFTAGEQTEANIGSLQPHPRNEDLYDDRENDELVSRMERVGFRESQRILITEDATILSGHRRWDAATKAGIETVPVEVVGIDPDSKEAELELLTANTHREKTDVEQYREVVAWRELIYERSESLEEVQPNKQSHPREVAAEKAGVPESRFAKMDRVKRAADDGSEVAKEQWEQLEDENQSVHGAYTAVVDAEKDDEEPDDTDDQGDDQTDTTEEQDTSDDGEDDVEELDYPDEIRQWTHSSKPTGAVYGAKADVEVYGLVQVVLEELDDGWQVYVDGPGQTERIVVCSGREYSLAADAMLGYLDSTKPDAARRSIDTEETRESDTTAADKIGGDTDEDSSEDVSSTQQDATGDGRDGSDPSDAGDEEAADEATADGGVGVKRTESQRIGDLVDEVKTLEEENERLEERVEKLRRASADQAQIIFELRYGDELSKEDVEELQNKVLDAAEKMEMVKGAKESLDLAVENVPEEALGHSTVVDAHSSLSQVVDDVE